MTFTKKFKLRGNSPQINKLKNELTRLINNGGDNGEEILSLEDQIQLLVDEDVEKALQNRKNFRILEDERPTKSFLNLENAKRGYNEVMLIKKENTDFNPNLPESQDNLKHVEIKDRQGINDEFHRAFQKIYAKQENVDDSTEAIQDFLNSGDDTLPSAYISNIALSDAERDRAEGEITMQELEYSLFKKMKGSSAPGIDGFTVNWLRKFW